MIPLLIWYFGIPGYLWTTPECADVKAMKTGVAVPARCYFHFRPYLPTHFVPVKLYPFEHQKFYPPYPPP